jgi:hypothetical protein
MPLYPSSPVPSEVHPPEIIDPSIEFVSDYGYSIRRPRTSRPRRRWTLDYLGMSTASMRVIRDFLQEVRFGAGDIQFFHPTAIELATFQPTTPVNVLLFHGMTTGMWVGVSNTPNPNINGGVFQITRTTDSSFTLNGTTGAGIQGNGNVIIYVPHATVVTQDGTFSAPSTLIGPERIPIAPDVYRGIYNFQVTLEEQF